MRRIGHCGTLDPLASGVLVTCLGRYTRLSQWISGAEKEYQSTFRLGATSDTGDSQGNLTSKVVAGPPTLNEIDAAMASFRGRILQAPPAYSAVKIGGVRSYELARQQQQVTAPARQIEVSTFEVASFRYPELKVRIVCSKGTYVRALASDLGELLGCGAYVEQLRRIRAGAVSERDSISLDEVQRRLEAGEIELPFISPKVALRPLPDLTVPQVALAAFLHGNAISLTDTAQRLPDLADGTQCAVFDEGERLCGIGEWGGEGSLRPVKVLVNER